MRLRRDGAQAQPIDQRAPDGPTTATVSISRMARFSVRIGGVVVGGGGGCPDVGQGLGERVDVVRGPSDEQPVEGRRQ